MIMPSQYKPLAYQRDFHFGFTVCKPRKYVKLMNETKQLFQNIMKRPGNDYIQHVKFHNVC